MADGFSSFAETIYKNKYSHKFADGTKEDWGQISWRVSSEVFSAVPVVPDLMIRFSKKVEARNTIPGGRYLYAAGRKVHQTQNCFLLQAEDSREGWSDLTHKTMMSLMTGGGIGVVYSKVRGEGEPIQGSGGIATGPIALMKIQNEVGREVMQGGSRRSALWAGLHWWHPDVQKFIYLKNWTKEVRELKAKDFNFPATMDMTNISVILDDEFFVAYGDENHEKHGAANAVYWNVVERMLKTSEPGFSIDIGENAGECLRNACTEAVSRDDSDVCNLISINLARINSIDEFRENVHDATAFAVAGTAYSTVPYDKVAEIREKNRRLGVGLMGFHEWLMKRHKPYGPDSELEKWLEIYEEESDYAAEKWAKEWGFAVPIKKRAIAPTGTIGLVAETSTGIEPFTCAARKRRYLDGRTWKFQYVIEPAIKRLVEEEGVKPADVEDAYSIDVERRLEMQAWVQQYVDNAISSTINLPAWGSEKNNRNRITEYGDLFMKWLPKLRGLTVYADGSRDGQPIVPVPYEEAIGQEGIEFVEEGTDICEISGKGGTCGG